MNEYCVKTAYVKVTDKFGTGYINELFGVKDIGFFKKHVVFWMTDGNIQAFKADNVVEISTKIE